MTIYICYMFYMFIEYVNQSVPREREREVLRVGDRYNIGT